MKKKDFILNKIKEIQSTKQNSVAILLRSNREVAEWSTFYLKIHDLKSPQILTH